MQLTQNNDRRAVASASYSVHQATLTEYISNIAKSAYHAGSLPLHEFKHFNNASNKSASANKRLAEEVEQPMCESNRLHTMPVDDNGRCPPVYPHVVPPAALVEHLGGVRRC
jgi:hypothetical protein